MNGHKNILIVGSQRSGTTLLNRILNTHPSIAMLYQQCNFLRHQAVGRTAIEQNVAVDIITTVSRAVAPYSPLFDRPTVGRLLRRVREEESIDPANLYDAILSMSLKNKKPDALYFGEKYAGRAAEIFPFKMIFPRGKIIYIVRDPRDVLVSEKGRLAKAAPSTRGHALYTILDWKISARSYIWARKHLTDIFLVRYEELIANPSQQIARIWDFLKVPQVEVSAETPLTDDAGNEWNANSSFDDSITGIGNKTTGRWPLLIGLSDLVFLPCFLGSEATSLGYDIGVDAGLFSSNYHDLCVEYLERDVGERLEIMQKFANSEASPQGNKMASDVDELQYRSILSTRKVAEVLTECAYT